MNTSVCHSYDKIFKRSLLNRSLEPITFFHKTLNASGPQTGKNDGDLNQYKINNSGPGLWTWYVRCPGGSPFLIGILEKQPGTNASVYSGWKEEEEKKKVPWLFPKTDLLWFGKQSCWSQGLQRCAAYKFKVQRGEPSVRHTQTKTNTHTHIQTHTNTKSVSVRNVSLI